MAHESVPQPPKPEDGETQMTGTNFATGEPGFKDEPIIVPRPEDGAVANTDGTYDF